MRALASGAVTRRLPRPTGRHDVDQADPAAELARAAELLAANVRRLSSYLA